MPRGGTVTSLAFSPDGKTLATVGYDRTAQTWDVATGQPIGQPMSHSEAVTAVAFSPDGQRIATGSKCWAAAEAAFDEAVVARPFNTAILLERARFLVAHSQGHKADDDFARAFILGNRQRALLDTISSNESLFRRVVEESARSAAPLWDNRGESLAKTRPPRRGATLA
jgi:WD domain, G-beta repeat